MTSKPVSIESLLPAAEARGGLRGLEREALRVTRDGRIAKTPHPRALGSTLTHPSITTDFSEALPEFVTAPYPDSAKTLAELRKSRPSSPAISATSCCG